MPSVVPSTDVQSRRVQVRVLSTQHPARNPRALKEADALAAAGFEVELLTIASHAPSLPLDAELVAHGKWRLRYGVNLVGAPLRDRLRSALLRGQTRAARALLRRGILEMPETLGTVRPLLRAAVRRPAELTIVHVDGGLWIGSRLAAAGHKVAADFEDWHSEDLLPENRRMLPLRLLRSVESMLLHEAVYTTATSQAMAQALVDRYGGRRPCVLPNAFPLQPEPRRWPRSGRPSLLWFSQTLGPGRGLEAFVAAWARSTRPSRLVLLGHSAPEYVAALRRAIPSHRQSDLTVLPPVPPTVLPSVIAQHDVGLALERAEPLSRDLTITNKLLQYLNAGLAIVATATRGQHEVLDRQPGLGRFVQLDDPDSVARTIDDLLGDEAELVAQQRASRRLAEDCYCWERHAGAVVERAREALRTSAG